MRLKKFFLTLLLPFAAIPYVASAQPIGWIDAGTWYYQEIEAGKTCRIKAKKANISGSVEIPQKLTLGAGRELTVIEIGDRAFLDRGELTAVNIPSSVTAIGARAFMGCEGLTAVAIPGTVNTIKKSAFRSCSNLARVALAEGVTAIGESAFEQCIRLESVAIPKGVKTIEFQAFHGCKGLLAVTLPEGLETIGSAAFSNCHGLTNVTLPEGMNTIGAYAFSNCQGLAAVTIHAGLKSIEEGAFGLCAKLERVNWLADPNVAVGSQAFNRVKSGARLVVRKGKEDEFRKQKWVTDYNFAVVGGHVVTFDAHGGQLAAGSEKLLLVLDREKIEKPGNPTKQGFHFVCWKFGDMEYKFGSEVTSDIKLEATWEKTSPGGTIPPVPPAPQVPSAPAPTDPTAVESQKLAFVRTVVNPMGDALMLEGLEGAERLEVYSLAGVKIYSQTLRHERCIAVSASVWPGGLYVVRVIARDGERALRVVKR